MTKITPKNEALKKISLTEKVGQLFMPAAFINDTEEEIQQLEKLISEHHVGGLCFFHSRASAATNFEGKKKVIVNENSFDTLKNLIKRYQKSATYPLLISIDAEWGLAMRIENTPQYPYAITLGANTKNKDLVFEVGQNIAKDCKAAGIHWNLSPVIDVNINPDNPVIGYRSFGSDKCTIVSLAKAYIKGTQYEGVLTSIKHFPGHGDTETDSHLDLPVIEKTKEELLETELYTFQKIIDEGVDSVMVGHLSVPALTTSPELPSSINKDIISGVLRNEMGFDGVVISDALNMHAVSKNYPVKGELEWLAFNAGNDVLCFAEHIKEGIQFILKNASEAQVNKSFERIWKLKEKAIIEDDTIKRLTDPRFLNRKIAERSLTLHHGTPKQIEAFRATDFCTLTLKRFGTDQTDKEIIDDLAEMRKEVKNETEILLLLSTPQIKPTNNFGFLQEEIDFVNEIITIKNVVLYHFGNPYALKLFLTHKTRATVIAYQNFKEFQDVATAHFLGTLKAKGKLPVLLK